MNDTTPTQNEQSAHPELDTDPDNESVGWFEALGSPVPEEQRERAAKQAQDIGVDVSPDDDWITDVSKFVELDRPEEAIETCCEHLDMTGTYRFLAYLCTPVQEASHNTEA